MGRDKATMLVDGVPMAMRVARALTDAGCRPVVAIGGDPGALSLTVVPDLFPGEGPLGGVITALRHAGGDVLVASCDLPSLTPAAVSDVLHALTGDAHVAIATTDRDQPLCAVWRATALPVLEERFQAGERRVRSVLEALTVVRVPVPPELLVNVNTIADLHE